jgi:hypothetical protein
MYTLILELFNMITDCLNYMKSLDISVANIN